MQPTQVKFGLRACGGRLFYGPLPVGSLRASKIDSVVTAIDVVDRTAARSATTTWMRSTPVSIDRPGRLGRAISHRRAERRLDTARVDADLTQPAREAAHDQADKLVGASDAHEGE